MKRLLICLMIVSSCSHTPRYKIGDCISALNIYSGKCKIVGIMKPYYTVKCQGQSGLKQPEIDWVDNYLTKVSCPEGL